MDIREKEQLGNFLRQLCQARIGTKDAEADGMIRDACRQQPDAAYLLVQRALLLEHALRDSQAATARLQAELDQARSGRSFLADANGWGQAPTAAPAPAYAPAASQPAPAAAMQGSATAAPAGAGWGGSFLGNMATTAAGVVAGSFIFQGLENAFGHHASPWGQASGDHFAAPPSETVVNNYYDGSGDSGAGTGNDLDSLSLDDTGDWGA